MVFLNFDSEFYLFFNYFPPISMQKVKFIFMLYIISFLIQFSFLKFTISSTCDCSILIHLINSFGKAETKNPKFFYNLTKLKLSEKLCIDDEKLKA